MLAARLRHAATSVLELAIRMAPPEAREWGEAMRGELGYVEGSWTALMWALGGARVMVKHALLSLLIPGRGSTAPGDELFARRVSLRKAAVVAASGCVLAALLFFLAPPFRQAFQVAVKPWAFIFQIASRNLQPGFETLARRAESQHDPEGLAFCAVRVRYPRESVRLAEEAVRLDPNLLWVYAVVGLRHPDVPEVSQWVPQLEGWDPQNAVPYLIAAEVIERAHFRRGVWSPPTAKQDQAWQDAMAAAFRSPKFDYYLDRVDELNRKIVPRYGFYDPYEVESRDEVEFPTSAFENSERFAKFQLGAGTDLEAKGDRKKAHDKYWTVARFGQVIDSQGRSGLEHWAGTTLQAMAYKQLQTSAEKDGQQTEAALFGYLAAKFDPVTGEHPKLARGWTFGQYTSSRNAAVVEISGLMILVFAALVVIAAWLLVASSRRVARPAAQCARPIATMVLATSGVGLLFSAITLYLTYRPYWYMFQRAILDGGSNQTRDLPDFLNATRMLPGIPPRAYLNALLYAGSPGFLFYVWTGVTLLGVSGLVFIFLRHVWAAREPTLRHSPRVP